MWGGKKISVCVVCLLWWHTSVMATSTEFTQISADAAILMNAGSGAVLWSHQDHKWRAPASTTKIMTAIVALEQGRVDDFVTVSQHAAATEGSSMELTNGERLTLGDLLAGLLLCSGNDAAVAIAEHIAGSEQNFVAMMNEKAWQIGAQNTHFCNPHGLDMPGHYSTAYDLAVMTRYAFRYPLFNELVRQRCVDIGSSHHSKRTLYSTNQLLAMMQEADGVKTGTTNQAGYCLVSSATHQYRRLIVVVLDSDDRYDDAMNLFTYGFRLWW